MVEKAVGEDEMDILNEITEGRTLSILDLLFDCVQIHWTGDNFMIVWILE